MTTASDSTTLTSLQSQNSQNSLASHDPHARHMIRGSSLHKAGRPELALLEFEAAIAALPSDPNALSACATVLSELDLKAASYRLLATRREALASDVEGLTNLGVAADQCGETAHAQICFEEALAISPFHSRAVVKLCWLLARLGQFDKAVALAKAHFDFCSTASSNTSSANQPGQQNGSALLLFDLLLAMSRHDEALAVIESLTTDSTDTADASGGTNFREHLQARHALIHGLLGNLDEARVRFAHLDGRARVALSAIPGLPLPLAQLVARTPLDIDSLLVVCASQTLLRGNWKSEKALTSLLKSVSLPREASSAPAELQVGWRSLQRIAAMLPLSSDERAGIANLSTEQSQAASVPRRDLARHWHPGLGDSRVRLGIAVHGMDDAHLSAKIARVLRLHDRKRFRIGLYCVTDKPKPEVYEPLRALADDIVEIAHLSPTEAVARIRLDRLDLLIDMTGHAPTVLDSALWQRVARQQIALPLWTEHLHGTPYDAAIEDTLTQATLSPRDAAPEDAARSAERIDRRKSEGLPEDAFVITCMPAPFMVDESTFDQWMNVLRRVPHALLWLPFYSDAIHDYWRAAAAERGIDIGRLVFSKNLGHLSDTSLLRAADVYVDTLRINSQEGLADALMAGVPALCVAGDTLAARQSMKILRGEGLVDCVHLTARSCEDAVVALSENAILRSALADQVHRALTGPRAIRSMNKMLEWENSLVALAALAKSSPPPGA